MDPCRVDDEPFYASGMNEQWYWDLEKQRAVPESERAADDRVLGPYPTKGHAENWQAQVERRNESWDDADDDWENWPTDR